MVHTIVAGGQSGADRAALDFAIFHSIFHRGWCPKGRLAEDGPIPLRYNLMETKSDKYPPRTELNVRYADGTLIFKQARVAERGCILTLNLCNKHEKPSIVFEIDVFKTLSNNNFSKQITKFIIDNNIKILNVAGNRESKAPGIYSVVLENLMLVPRELFAMPAILKKLKEDTK